MKQNIKTFLICLAIPLGVGILASLLTGGGMGDYAVINNPPLSPPGWLFPIVWTALYLLMGYASYRIFTSGNDPIQVKGALKLYGIQLALNFLWPLLFFGFKWYWAAFVLLLGLWVAIYLTIRAFSTIDEKAGDLLIPYLLWVTFAGYLNAGVAILN